MKITVVVDNCVPPSAPRQLVGEHGFSLLIEANSTKILLDTGQTDAVVHNLSILGIHPAEIDAIVLSHGHYDHTGGLLHLLKHRRKKIPIYAHPDIFISHYSTARGSKNYIGIPYVKEELISLGAEWNFIDKPTELFLNLWYSGSIPRITDFEVGDANLMLSNSEGDWRDTIQDDISLFYAGDKGLVVIGGCTHSGLVNTVRYGLEVTKKNRLWGWVGGTHLGPVSLDQQNKTLAFLEKQAPEFIAASHCTGFSMMSELKARFDNKFLPAFVSTSIEC